MSLSPVNKELGALGGPGQGNLEPTEKEPTEKELQRAEIIRLKDQLQALLDKSFNIRIGDLSTFLILEIIGAAIDTPSQQAIDDLHIYIAFQQKAVELLKKRNYPEAYTLAVDQAEVRIREMLDPGCLMTYKQLQAIRLFLGEAQISYQAMLNKQSRSYLNHDFPLAEVIARLPVYVLTRYLSRFGELFDDQIISGKEVRGQAETEDQKLARLIHEGVEAAISAAKNYFPSGDQLGFAVKLSIICQQQNGSLVVIEDQLAASNLEELKNEDTVRLFVEKLIRKHEATLLGTKAVVFGVEITDLISPVN